MLYQRNCCDPAVVTVDEHKKLCSITQKYIDYHNLYIVARRKKESMKIETTASARQREATYPSEKKRGRHIPWIFSWFPKIWGSWNLTSSHLRGSCSTVHLFLITFCHQLFKKLQVVLSLWPIVSAGQKIRFISLRTCLHDLRSSRLPYSFFMISSALAWLFGHCLIYLFIQFQFFMSRLITLQVYILCPKILFF